MRAQGSTSSLSGMGLSVRLRSGPSLPSSEQRGVPWSGLSPGVLLVLGLLQASEPSLHQDSSGSLAKPWGICLSGTAGSTRNQVVKMQVSEYSTGVCGAGNGILCEVHAVDLRTAVTLRQ